jgi:tRNA(Phe) wybutosine-synthesizing methylase Tyw3
MWNLQERKMGKAKIRKKIKVTYSIPEEVNNLLHVFVERSKLSKFVSVALKKALKKEQQKLKAAYEAANKDLDRQRCLDDWF